MRLRPIEIGLSLPSSGKGAKEAIRSAVNALVSVNLAYLSHNSAPNLRSLGIRYRREPPHRRENWQSIPDILKSGSADCEDLSAWLVASLLHRGIPSVPYVTRKGNQWHIRVAANIEGKLVIFDPSKDLGMKT